MDTLIILWHLLKPWLCLVVYIYLCTKMITWAKRRKTGAIAFGLFFQMVLPDPNAQSTIEAVVEHKHKVKKQQDENGDPFDINKDFDAGDNSNGQ